jgi:hypothetical protein
MADNTILNANTTVGDTIRDIDHSGVKTQVVTLDIGGSTEQLISGVMPVAKTEDSGLNKPLQVNEELELTTNDHELKNEMQEIKVILADILFLLQSTIG